MEFANLIGSGCASTGSKQQVTSVEVGSASPQKSKIHRKHSQTTPPTRCRLSVTTVSWYRTCQFAAEATGSTGKVPGIPTAPSAKCRLSVWPTLACAVRTWHWQLWSQEYAPKLRSSEKLAVGVSTLNISKPPFKRIQERVSTLFIVVEWDSPIQPSRDDGWIATICWSRTVM